MKIYITKPQHTKYGRIKIDNPFRSIEELIENSLIWFNKPFFHKPFIDLFDEKIAWRSWESHYDSGILFSQFPEGEVKEALRQSVKNSINTDFYETLSNRYYTWIGEIDVEFIRKKKSGNFNLYLTKPSSAWDIRFAGIDRCKVFLSKPNCPLNFQYIENHIPYIQGKFFRKNKELENLTFEMWKSIKDSFDITDNNAVNFLESITATSHKDKQSCSEFIKEYFFDIQIKK